MLLLLTERSAHEYCSQCYLCIYQYITLTTLGDHPGLAPKTVSQNGCIVRKLRSAFFQRSILLLKEQNPAFALTVNSRGAPRPILERITLLIGHSSIHSLTHSSSSAIARTGGFETIGSISFYLPTSRLYCLPPPAHNTTKHFLSFTTSSAS